MAEPAFQMERGTERKGIAIRRTQAMLSNDEYV